MRLDRHGQPDPEMAGALTGTALGGLLTSACGRGQVAATVRVHPSLLSI
jgi:outer membrane lipoprotein SlyB